MTHYDSTARVPFAKGGKVDKKPPKPKRIILWKGKVKDWPGAQKAKERTGKQDGGNIFKHPGLKEKGKGVTSKWTTVAGKRSKKIGSKRKGSGKRKINPEWLEKKYNVDVKEREPRRKTLAVTDKYKKIRDSLGLKKGGKADKKWIQGVNKSIKKRGTKGVCTGKKFGGPTCRPGTKRYNLAKTFKKMARSKHASGGLVRFI